MTVNRALSILFRVRLGAYRALLSVHRALLSVHRALLSVHRGLLCVYRALLCVYRAFLRPVGGRKLFGERGDFRHEIALQKFISRALEVACCMCDMTHSYLRMCDMTQLYVHMCDMTHSCASKTHLACPRGSLKGDRPTSAYSMYMYPYT